MEERKEFIDGLAKYVKDIIYQIDNIDDPYYGDFEASYHKDDLIVIYKIIRMRKLNIIDNKEYYRLMNLYYEYLVLEGRINYISFLEYKGITDEAYFRDDIVGRFEDFLCVIYGEDTLEENLEFIADALGSKGSSSREKIREYFLCDFL